MKAIKENEIVGNYAYDNGDEYAFGDVEYTTPTITHNVWPTTNQAMNEASKSACTIFGALNQLIRLFGIDLAYKEANALGLELVDYCKQYGYIPGSGWSTPTAINCVCKWWNSVGYERYKTEKVFYVVKSRTDAKIQEALDKGHLVGFTYALNRNTDRYAGLVDKDDYPGGMGHRTNIKSPSLTNATSGLKVDNANEGVHDNYYLYTNEYYIKDITKYLLKGVYGNFYLIMPQSAMTNTTVEDEKIKIAKLKGVNAIIGALSSAYGELNVVEQAQASTLASLLRKNEGSRAQINDDKLKTYQAVVDLLSFAWKNAGEEEQKMYSELASYLRVKYGLN